MPKTTNKKLCPIALQPKMGTIALKWARKARKKNQSAINHWRLAINCQRWSSAFLEKTTCPLRSDQLFNVTCSLQKKWHLEAISSKTLAHYPGHSHKHSTSGKQQQVMQEHNAAKASTQPVQSIVFVME